MHVGVGLVHGNGPSHDAQGRRTPHHDRIAAVLTLGQGDDLTRGVDLIPLIEEQMERGVEQCRQGACLAAQHRGDGGIRPGALTGECDQPLIVDRGRRIESEVVGRCHGVGDRAVVAEGVAGEYRLIAAGQKAMKGHETVGVDGRRAVEALEWESPLRVRDEGELVEEQGPGMRAAGRAKRQRQCCQTGQESSQLGWAQAVCGHCCCP